MATTVVENNLLKCPSYVGAAWNRIICTHINPARVPMIQSQCGIDDHNRFILHTVQGTMADNISCGLTPQEIQLCQKKNFTKITLTGANSSASVICI